MMLIICSRDRLSLKIISVKKVLCLHKILSVNVSGFYLTLQINVVLIT